MSEQDYHMDHRPADASNGAPAHDLTGNGIYPNDVYTHPHYYGDTSDPAFKQTHQVLKSLQGKPDAMVNIYRSMPNSDNPSINPGDWVSLHPDYAKQHGMHPDDPSQDMPVYKTQAKASELHTSGDSLDEFGYNGPAAKPGQKIVKANISEYQTGDRVAVLFSNIYYGTGFVTKLKTAGKRVYTVETFDGTTYECESDDLQRAE